MKFGVTLVPAEVIATITLHLPPIPPGILGRVTNIRSLTASASHPLVRRV